MLVGPRTVGHTPWVPMLTLLILRHAKAEAGDGIADELRALAPRGRRDAQKMGEVARTEGLLPERILSSPAVRTRQTVELFVEASDCVASVEFLRPLYLAEPPAYLDAVARHAAGAKRVMLVGHNPGLEDLVRELTGEVVSLPTAALVECVLPVQRFESGVSLQEAGAELRRIFRPKDDG
jgi:phosphohistidine phosphatase